MKRFIVTALVVGVVASFAPARAENTSGTILIPTGTVSRAQRCASSTGAGTAAENGVFGVTFQVVEGLEFKLTSADPNADFDIAFYAGPPAACDENANSTGDYLNNNKPVDDTNDEAGIVPEGATHAAVTMFAGPPNSAFTYTETIPAGE